MSILAPALILLSTSFNAPSDSIKTDTLYSVDPIKEKIALRKDEPQKKRVGIFKRFIQSLSDYDTTYVSPNYYMFTAMGQNTNFFQRYRISATNDRQSQTLSMRPAPTAKIGPYFGWSWIFLVTPSMLPDHVNLESPPNLTSAFIVQFLDATSTMSKMKVIFVFEKQKDLAIFPQTHTTVQTFLASTQRLFQSVLTTYSIINTSPIPPPTIKARYSVKAAARGC